ncbi:replication protein [Aeromonas sp. A5]|uniref:replication protein n=1 Tax=unclassified Aeromonas TaxID=257493 RepID=UPI00376FD5B9
MSAVLQFPDTRANAQPQEQEVRVANFTDGYTRIANELYDALILADLSKREQKVAHAIARKTYGFNKDFDLISDSQLAEMTGLHRTHVCKAKNALLEHKILKREGRMIGLNKVISEWKSEEYQNSDTVAETATKDVAETATKVVAVLVHTKDKRKKKEKIMTEGASACAEPPSATPKSNPVKHTPYQTIVETYHELLPEMPGIRELTDSRKTRIRTFWHKFGFTEVRWRKYLEYIAANCHWMCESRERGQGQTWKPKNLDFLVTERCYLGVREGRFND